MPRWMAVPTLGSFAATSTDEKNAATSKKEVAQFKAGKAGKYFAYMSNDHKAIQTWMGDKLADVTYYGAPYKMPAFGWPSTRVNFRAKGIDGRNWSGTFFESSGNYVRMAPVKGTQAASSRRPKALSGLGDPYKQSYMDKAVASYIETALWSSTDNSNESGGDPLDDNYDESDLTAKSKLSMRKDVEAFIRGNVRDIGDMDAGKVGHNFWLNRNGHGAGFWDLGLGARGERLSKASKVYGSSDIYVGDDKKLHVS